MGVVPPLALSTSLRVGPVPATSGNPFAAMHTATLLVYKKLWSCGHPFLPHQTSAMAYMVDGIGNSLNAVAAPLKPQILATYQQHISQTTPHLSVVLSCLCQTIVQCQLPPW